MDMSGRRKVLAWSFSLASMFQVVDNCILLSYDAPDKSKHVPIA